MYGRSEDFNLKSAIFFYTNMNPLRVEQNFKFEIMTESFALDIFF